MSGSKKPALYTGAEPPKHPNPLQPIQQILPQTHNRGQYIDATKAMQRPKAFNSTGAPAIVQINSFPILKYPTRTVHQYDVSSLQSSITSPRLLTEHSTGHDWVWGREARFDQGSLGEQ